MFKFLFFLLALTAKADFVNVKVTRDLDLSEGIVRSKTVLKIENSGNSKLEIYEIPLEFPVDFFSVKLHSTVVKAELKNFKILVPVNLQSKDTVELELSLVFSKQLEPLPKKIGQFDQQSLLFNGNVYFYSPYLTKEVLTVVKLPNGNDLLTKLSGPKPFGKQGKQITFGPYADIKKFSSQQVKIHFYSSKSLLSASKVEKIVQVSQLGSSINFLEYYTLHHKGAE